MVALNAAARTLAAPRAFGKRGEDGRWPETALV